MTLKDRKEIRKAYKSWTPRSDPYQYFNWVNSFTPIEAIVWNDIRGIGLPFYPEFPVDKYFIDFADPIKKIGIEVDGKEFHQDYEKDNLRQRELEKLGWKIIRITGDKTQRNKRNYVLEKDEEIMTDEELEDELAPYYIETSEGIIRKLKRDFYKN